MDSDYEKIFQRLYDERPVFDDPRFYGLGPRYGPGFQRRIRREIDAAEESLSAIGLRLRSDARFFLLLNLAEMIYLPLELRGAARYDDVDLGSVISGDLNLLLSDAASRHRAQQADLAPGGEPVREISGHTVVESLAANWSRLKVNSFRIWGEE